MFTSRAGMGWLRSGAWVLSFAFLAGLHAQSPLDVQFGINGKLRIDVDEYDECHVMHSYAGTRQLLLGGISGHTSGSDFDMDMTLVRRLEDGSPDTSFGSGGTVKKDFSGCDYSTLQDMLALDNGRILVLGRGYATAAPGDQPFFIACFLPDGSPDTSFGNYGETAVHFIGPYNEAHAMTIDHTGRIYAVGVSYDTTSAHTELPAILRLLPDGSIDSSFGGTGRMVVNFLQGDLLPVQTGWLLGNERHVNGGFFTDIQLLDDGNLLCAGAYDNGIFRQSLLVKILPDGRLDTAFMNQGISVFDIEPGYENYVHRIALRNDGRLFMGITMNCPFFANDWYMATCTLEDPDAVDFFMYDIESHEDRLRDFTFLPDGKILVAGYSSHPGNSSTSYTSDYFALGRTEAAGSQLDILFNQAGYFFTEFESGNYRSGANALLVQDDDKIVLGGMVNTSGGANDYDMALLRLEAPLTGVNETETDFLQLWPNPVTETLHIQLTEGADLLWLMDMQGRVMYEQHSLSGGMVSIPVHGFAPGVYAVEYVIGARSSSLKIIIQSSR